MENGERANLGDRRRGRDGDEAEFISEAVRTEPEAFRSVHPNSRTRGSDEWAALGWRRQANCTFPVWFEHTCCKLILKERKRSILHSGPVLMIWGPGARDYSWGSLKNSDINNSNNNYIYINFANKPDASKIDLRKKLYKLVLYDIILKIYSSNSICKVIN